MYIHTYIYIYIYIYIYNFFLVNEMKEIALWGSVFGF